MPGITAEVASQTIDTNTLESIRHHSCEEVYACGVSVRMRERERERVREEEEEGRYECVRVPVLVNNHYMYYYYELSHIIHIPFEQRVQVASPPGDTYPG